jgi:hypothetical protein
VIEPEVEGHAGSTAGAVVGEVAGEMVGDTVGEVVGVVVGEVVGADVVGDLVGEMVGESVMTMQSTTTLPATKMDGPSAPHPVDANAFSPIAVTVSGIVIVVIPDPSNALNPMLAS